MVTYEVMAGVKVTLDKKLCISCNLCNEVVPKVFYTKGEKSAVREGVDFSSKEILEKVVLAEQACPVRAITVFR